MTDRITRTYFARWPRWRTRYEKPVNWLLFRWGDGLPLAIGMAVAAFTAPEWVADVLVGWYIVGFPILFYRRLRARARYCATHGHTPYKPVPEVDEWECLYCGSLVRVSGPQTAATSAAHAASELELGMARRRSQARYSDRR